MIFHRHIFGNINHLLYFKYDNYPNNYYVFPKWIVLFDSLDYHTIYYFKWLLTPLFLILFGLLNWFFFKIKKQAEGLTLITLIYAIGIFLIIGLLLFGWVIIILKI